MRFSMLLTDLADELKRGITDPLNLRVAVVEKVKEVRCCLYNKDVNYISVVKEESFQKFKTTGRPKKGCQQNFLSSNIAF